MRDSGRVIAVLVAFIFIISSFGVVGGQEDESLILRVAQQDDIKTLNPLVGGDVWTWNLLGYLYDGPIKTDDDENLIPYIAVGTASQTSKTDPFTYTWNDCTIGEFEFTPEELWQNDSITGEMTVFYDFTDVFWHDGTQMTIRDILFSYHVCGVSAVWDDKADIVGCLRSDIFTQNHKLFIEPVWESDDDFRAALKFTLQVPFADFFESTLSVFLLPYHIWASTESGQPYDEMKIWLDAGYELGSPMAWDALKANQWENPNPVGSGVFKWDSWTPGVSSKITTYRDHFYKPGFQYDVIDPDTGKGIAKQPMIDAIVYKIFKTAEQAVLALRNNEVDYIAWSIPPTFVMDLMNEQDISIMQSEEKGFFYLGYNMRPERRSFGYNDAGEDVGKPLRRAIAHCIDKETIVQRYFQGFVIAADGPVSPNSEWYNSSIPKYVFDPTEARNILWDAGYRPMNGGVKYSSGPDNWWLNPDGSPIGNGVNGEIEVLVPPQSYDYYRYHFMTMVVTQMRDVGINAEVIMMDFGTIVQRIDDRDFDMYNLGWRIGSDPVDFLHAFFHSDNADTGQNYPGYRNISLDNILEDARATYDDDVRKELISEALAAIAYDLPYDILYFRTNIEAYRSDRFIGWVVGPTGSIFNQESIVNLKPAPEYWQRLNAQFVNLPSACISNSTDTEVEILVTGWYKDPVTEELSREPVKDAKVVLEVSNGTFGDTGQRKYNATTDSQGKIKIYYNAPYVPSFGEPGYLPDYENGTQVLFQIKDATYEGFSPALPKITLMKIYPKDIDFLSVMMSVNPDVVDDIDAAGQLGIALVDVWVTDQNGIETTDATVIVQVDPAEPTISPTEATTNSQGKANFTITAVDVDEDREYVILVLAKKAGYKDGGQSIKLFVANYTPPTILLPKSDWLPEILLSVIAFCGVALVLNFYIRRKSKP